MNIPYNAESLHRLSNSVYVVLMKGKNGHLTLLADPGTQKPWSSHNKKSADYQAHENKGEARTWAEAFGLLLKEYPGFEKELIERIAKARTDTSHDIVTN
jgi:hypothetical protein